MHIFDDVDRQRDIAVFVIDAERSSVNDRRESVGISLSSRALQRFAWSSSRIISKLTWGKSNGIPVPCVYRPPNPLSFFRDIVWESGPRIAM
jgi:hypothetical protein